MQHLFRLGIDIDFSDEAGFMALHHAVLSGFEDCVQVLIEWGSDVNAMTQHGVPLNLAAEKEREHVISILVGARADKARAVDFAVAHGHDVENLRLLLNVANPRARVGALAASGADDQVAVEEDQLLAPTSIHQKVEEPKIDTKSIDEVKQLYSHIDGGDSTKDEGSRAGSSQHHPYAQRDDSSDPGEETFARRGRGHSHSMSAIRSFFLGSFLSHCLETERMPRQVPATSQQTSQGTPQATSEHDLSAFKPERPRSPRLSSVTREDADMLLRSENEHGRAGYLQGIPIASLYRGNFERLSYDEMDCPLTEPYIRHDSRDQQDDRPKESSDSHVESDIGGRNWLAKFRVR